MARGEVPQPHPDRITPFAGRPVVVGVVPDQPTLVTQTAIAQARATGGSLCFAYVDPSRVVEAEHADGTVAHAPVDPDLPDDDWRRIAGEIEAELTRLVDPSGVPWRFVYLAGRPDRALTHLARAVDAAAFVVGTRAPGVRRTLHDFFEGSVAVHLAHHQHRPVLVVPLQVVDWSERIAAD